MTHQDLKDLLAFAESHNLMKEPFTKVYELWLKDLQEYYEDSVADYWIDQHKAGLI